MHLSGGRIPIKCQLPDDEVPVWLKDMTPVDYLVRVVLELYLIHLQILFHCSEVQIHCSRNPADWTMLHFVEPFDLVVHNQSTECFAILFCHNTFAKSYDTKVWVNNQIRCIPVAVFAALLLPIFFVFLDSGYIKETLSFIQGVRQGKQSAKSISTRIFCALSVFPLNKC